jgi:hypothetical protein
MATRVKPPVASGFRARASSACSTASPWMEETMNRNAEPRASRGRLPAVAMALFVMGALGLVQGCGGDDPTGLAPAPVPPGTTVPTSGLTFVPLGRNTPALRDTSASFWAKVGDEREVRLYYLPRAGQSDSTEYLRFRVRDLASLTVEFSPAGLRFDPDEPAELKLSFGEKDGDLNDDGRTDAADDAVLSRLGLWRREAASLPWVKLSSRIKVETDEIEADITGFTSYAIAY